MRRIICVIFIILPCIFSLQAKEYHVAMNGSDAADGSASAPFRTINHAAQIALPGDTVTVHAGTYREWINPLSGGDSNARRILYRAAEGETVEVKGSELVTGWKKEKKGKGVWKVVLPNSFFGDYNPFNDRLYGDWLWSDRIHHTADVYLNDVSLYEEFSLDKVYAPDTLKTIRDPEGCTNVWFAVVDGDNTTIYANFGSADPNKETVEVSVRPTCFYPSEEGLNYITIRGFHFSQAATQWAAPTAEQVGIVSTHWCKGWIIENNVIKNSRACGITLGKEGATGQNPLCYDPRRLDGGLYYIETIFNVLRHGWSKEYVGSHIVRNNVISDCEQTGICGSMGGAFSEIYGNHIYNILVKKQYGGAEMAGIKLHGAVDVYIHHNRIHHNGSFGIWLDWMAQGARVSSNLVYDNLIQDVFIEVSHGPYKVDNNIFLSKQSFTENTDGGSYSHNLFGGDMYRFDDQRYTPYHLNHSTQVKGLSTITEGDHRFYNNIFIGGDRENSKYGLTAYEASKRPIYAEDNLFLNGAKSRSGKSDGWQENVNPNIKIEETDNGEVYLICDFGMNELEQYKGKKVDSDRLGVTQLSGYPFENQDGTPYNVDTDYFGNKRSDNPVVGPFEKLSTTTRLKVWPSLN